MKSDAYKIRRREFKTLFDIMPLWDNLDRTIINLLIDQLILLRNMEETSLTMDDEEVMEPGISHVVQCNANTTKLYVDYCFIIAPAYKAFEGFLLLIAGELGLPVDEYKKHIGGLYSWKDEDKEHEKFIEMIKTKLQHDQETMDIWRELGTVLRQYRHNPAHFDGDAIYSYDAAKGHVMTILTVMNNTMRHLIAKKLLKQKNRFREE